MATEQHKLKKCAFGISLGLTWAAGLVALVIINACYPHWGNQMIQIFGDVYLGYKTSFIGAIYGALWGFADGFIGGFFIALFYNLSQCCCSKKKKK